MGTEDWTGPLTRSNPEAYSLDTKMLYKKLIDESVARKIFPSFKPILKNHQTTFRIWDVLDDLKTNYGMKAANFPINEQRLRPKEFDVPKLFTKLMYDKDELAEMNDSLLPFDVRVQRAIAKIAEDEDMYTIAGESTVNGVTSFADETNFSTNMATSLEFVTFTTIKTSLNTNIALLNAGLKAAKVGIRNAKQAPLILLVTQDVEDYLMSVTSSATATDERITDGVDMVNSILMKRGGLGSGIHVSDHLGATVSRDGNAFKVTTDGTTNAALFSRHELVIGAASSMLRQTPAMQPNGDMEYELDERLVPYSVVQGGILYDSAVDLTP